MRRLRHWLSKLALPALALVVLGNGGCLLIAAGAAAGGAAAYTYYNGLLYRDYHANLADSLPAVRVALSELQFPILEQKTDTGTAFLKTRTADGNTVRIHLEVVPSPIPAEGSLTRVGIRVGFAGDEAVSARILDQINLHLVPPGAIPAPPVRPSGASLGNPQPIPQEQPGDLRRAVHETAPPPLAPPSGGPSGSPAR